MMFNVNSVELGFVRSLLYVMFMVYDGLNSLYMFSNASANALVEMVLPSFML